MPAGEPIVVITGATGVGKSGVGLSVAERYAGEIISADSMAVYRGMDIGTDKPGGSARTRVPHHLVDIVDPDQDFSAGDFKARAKAAIGDVSSRGRLPLVVGGTALYVRSLLYDYPLAKVGSDPDLRASLEEREIREGAGTLHRMLESIDPDSSARLHQNDLRRIIRAIEVHRLTGTTMTRWRESTPPEMSYRALLVGLWRPREEIYRRIDTRVERMFEEGLVDEVRQLLETYPGLGRTASQALGYREVLTYLAGEIDLGYCVELTKANTRKFAKRQLMWFRGEPQLRWVDAAAAPERVSELIGIWSMNLQNSSHCPGGIGGVSSNTASKRQ